MVHMYSCKYVLFKFKGYLYHPRRSVRPQKWTQTLVCDSFGSVLPCHHSSRTRHLWLWPPWSGGRVGTAERGARGEPTAGNTGSGRGFGWESNGPMDHDQFRQSPERRCVHPHALIPCVSLPSQKSFTRFGLSIPWRTGCFLWESYLFGDAVSTVCFHPQQLRKSSSVVNTVSGVWRNVTVALRRIGDKILFSFAYSHFFLLLCVCLIYVFPYFKNMKP